MEAVPGPEMINNTQTNSVAVAEMPPSRSWFSWCPTSDKLLEYAESRILKHLKTHYEKKFVPVVKGNNVWTVKFNPSAKNIPLVMVHGFGGGLGLWALNIDNLAKNRPVYTFDLLGFGRSSRPHFSSEADMTEQEFVESIESWRKEVGLEKFILLGHSLGGFLSCSYALKHPDKVKHLILVDPWGFPEKPSDDDEFQARIPRWVKVLGAVLSPFNPLAGLRAAGPFGPSMVQKFRPDFQRKYQSLFDEDDTILNYIYHCNAQTPSGETAFKHLSIPYGWAKFPMVNRVGNLDKRIPITFIYGARSWVDNDSAYNVKHIRGDKYVDIQIIKGAGHHVYADRPEPFNNVLEKVYEMVDSSVDKEPEPVYRLESPV